MKEKNAICIECGGTYIGLFFPDKCPACKKKENEAHRRYRAKEISDGLRAEGYPDSADCILKEAGLV